MGKDKGGISYRGKPHARYLAELLTRWADTVFVSINPTQIGCEPYIDLRVVVDDLPRHGPASGLLAARKIHADAAWLVVAVDLAWLDQDALDILVAARRSTASATAFVHRDGTLEPLCAIWEPSGLSALAYDVANGQYSARRCLERIDVEMRQCPTTRVIRSANSPDEKPHSAL